MMHVSKEILWVSPVVDLLLFLIVTVFGSLLAYATGRHNAWRSIVSMLLFLAVYDLLTLTGRLWLIARLSLALGGAIRFSRWFANNELAALQFWKKTAPWVIAAFAFAFVGVQGGKWLRERNETLKLPPAAPGSPNVLVIVVDTLRADHLSGYGYSRPTSADIDRIAAQGVLFENAISACSWTLPSHVSLLTGRYQFEHGVGGIQPEPWLGWGRSSFRGYPTLGETLQKRGYRTGAFSANRVNFTRNLGFGRGFIHFEDYFHSASDAFVRTLYGREFGQTYLSRSDRSLVRRILRRLGFTRLLDRDLEGWGGRGAMSPRKRADVINQEVLRWIDRDRQRPFFAFLNYLDVHDRYGAPEWYPKPSWPQDGPIDAYDDGVKYENDYIARLMWALDQRGLLKHTLVVFTSDHGESLGQHGLNLHGTTLLWELIHVPLVIWYPGHVPAGVRVARPVSNTAIPATIMDLLGAEQMFPGPPLSGFWKMPQAEANWPNPLSERAEDPEAGADNAIGNRQIPTAATGAMSSVVTPQWHLIVHAKLGRQLYDLVRDPGELNNLINTLAGQAAAADLESQIRQFKFSRTRTQR